MTRCRIYRVFEYSQLQRLAQAGGQTVFYIFMSLIAVIVVFSGCLCLFVAQVKRRLQVWWPLSSHSLLCPDIQYLLLQNFRANSFPYVWPIKLLRFSVSIFFDMFCEFGSCPTLSVQVVDQACQQPAMPALVAMQTQQPPCACRRVVPGVPHHWLQLQNHPCTSALLDP